MKPGIRWGILQGARKGLLVGLCLAALYLVIYALGDVERAKSLGFSLLFVGFPTLFAVVPALEWLGVQGGRIEGVAALFVTLTVNGTLWGAVIGAGLGLWERIRRKPAPLLDTQGGPP